MKWPVPYVRQHQRGGMNVSTGRQEDIVDKFDIILVMC